MTSTEKKIEKNKKFNIKTPPDQLSPFNRRVQRAVKFLEDGGSPVPRIIQEFLHCTDREFSGVFEALRVMRLLR